MDIMKLRALALIIILIGAVLASGCCVCCVPCGTTRAQGQANEQAQSGGALTYSDHSASSPVYAGNASA